MAAADLTRSIVHILEDLILDATVPVKAFITDSASVTTPTWGAPAAASSVSASATQTVTGVALGDSVVGVSFSVDLPANQLYAGSYVFAANTVKHVFTSTAAGAVTGAAVTVKVIVADLT